MPIGTPHVRFMPLAYGVFALFLCAPILDVTYPPLADYTAHLARTAVLARYNDVALFRTSYDIRYEPIGNLAIEAVVVPMSHFLGVMAAGKLFLILIVLLYAVGCYLLAHAIHGGRTWMALVPLPWIFNSALLVGLVNYAAGVGLYLIALAAWLRWRTSWNFPRYLVFTILVTICYLAHLSSVGLLGISMAAATVWEGFAGRRPYRAIVTAGSAFLPAMTLFLVFMRGSGQVGHVEWGSLARKGIELFVVVRTYSLWTDAVLLLGLLACILYAALKSNGFWSYGPGLAASAALVLAFLVSPDVLFTSGTAAVRFLWPGCVLLALSCQPRLPTRAGALCLFAFLGIYVVRTGVIALQWRQFDARASRIVKLFDCIPQQVRVYPAFFSERGGFDAAKADQTLLFTVCYATVTRNAYVPTVYAIRGQQPLIDKRDPDFQRWKPASAAAMRNYDYVWAYNPPPEFLAQLEKSAILVAHVDESSLWRRQCPVPLPGALTAP